MIIMNITDHIKHIIKNRQEQINRLQTNPPAGWTAEFTALNIRIIQGQIDVLI
jgi:hypothetical protein